MSNAQYTNVNNVKRVKQTHHDNRNTKHDGSWFISAEKELKTIFKLRTKWELQRTSLSSTKYVSKISCLASLGICYYVTYSIKNMLHIIMFLKDCFDR